MRRYRERQKARKAGKATPAKAPPRVATEGAAAHGASLLELDAAKARKVKAEAELAELTLAERRGEVVRTSTVRAFLACYTQALKSGVDGVDAHLARHVSSLGDAELAAIRRELRRMVHRALAEGRENARRVVAKGAEARGLLEGSEP
ncbi:MAG: terminase small subunit [Gammaproteobacteria bacterium]|nr:terminase small subunit [Gammaproteobacteria bacterium]